MEGNAGLDELLQGNRQPEPRMPIAELASLDYYNRAAGALLLQLDPQSPAVLEASQQA